MLFSPLSARARSRPVVGIVELHRKTLRVSAEPGTNPPVLDRDPPASVQHPSLASPGSTATMLHWHA